MLSLQKNRYLYLLDYEGDCPNIKKIMDENNNRIHCVERYTKDRTCTDESDVLFFVILFVGVPILTLWSIKNRKH